MNRNIEERIVGENSGIGLRKYFQHLIRIWPFIMISLILCMGFAWFYLTYKAQPQYRVNAKLLLQEEGASASMGANPTSNLDINSILGSKSSVDNEIEVLKTRFLMESMVRDMGLNIRWFAKGSFRDVELFEVPIKIDIENGMINSNYIFDITKLDNRFFQLTYDSLDQTITKQIAFGEPVSISKLPIFRIEQKDSAAFTKGSMYTLKLTTVENSANQIRNAMTMALTSKATTVIDLGLGYTDPKQGEIVLSRFIDEYIRQNIRDKGRIADSTMAFIDKRIILVNGELDKIEGNLQMFKQGHGLANISAQAELLVQNSSEYSKQLTDLETRLAMMEAVEILMKDPNRISLISGNVMSGEQMDQGFNNFLIAYNNLVLERDRLLMSYTKDNPYVINIDKRLKTVRSNIINYIENTKNSLQTNKAALTRTSKSIKGSIREVPAQERQFLDLTRQQQLKQDLYLFLLQKREEIAVASTSNLAGIRIIDPARAEKIPFSPKRSMVYTVFFLLGLIFPIGYIVIKELANTKVKTRQDIQAKTLTPVIAELSHHEGDVDLLDFKSSRAPITEQFRGLRTNIKFLMATGKGKTILVTSGMPGEGKSFVSLNLANVYAASGVKVLLLEFDLRKPKLSKTYSNSKGLGITNFIVDPNLSLDDVINPVNTNENLFFGACGPIPPNPSELIMSARTRALFEAATEKFDIVIIDAPPIGAVTDGQLLSSYSDVALYIVRSGFTPKDLVVLAEDVRAEDKIKNLNIVLNDLRDNERSYYGYMYGEYGQEVKKKKWFRPR